MCKELEIEQRAKFLNIEVAVGDARQRCLSSYRAVIYVQFKVQKVISAKVFEGGLSLIEHKNCI